MSCQQKQKVLGQLLSPNFCHGPLRRTCLTCSSYAMILQESLLACMLDLRPQQFCTVATCALKDQEVISASLKKCCLSDIPVGLLIISVSYVIGVCLCLILLLFAHSCYFSVSNNCDEKHRSILTCLNVTQLTVQAAFFLSILPVLSNFCSLSVSILYKAADKTLRADRLNYSRKYSDSVCLLQQAS